MSKKTIGRAEITSRIHERTNGAIPYRRIYDCVSKIIEEIKSDLLQDQAVSVRRFGTLSPYTIKSHKANDVTTGEVRVLPPKKSVKLHSHDSFSELISERQESFKKDS